MDFCTGTFLNMVVPTVRVISDGFTDLPSILTMVLILKLEKNDTFGAKPCFPWTFVPGIIFKFH